mgnify:CR=1 FL=1
MCSGVIDEELNGANIVAVPLKDGFIHLVQENTLLGAAVSISAI